MKTTVDIDESLMQKAMRLYRNATKARIIEMGLKELIKTDLRSSLSEAFGSQSELVEPLRKR